MSPRRAGSPPNRLEDDLGGEPRKESLEVQGVPIGCRIWKSSGAERPATSFLLIHGNGARSEWWDGVAPLLSREAEVVALDLSGHGTSGWRAEYDFGAWSAEVRAVAREFCSGTHVILVGHSMGGLVAWTAAWDEPTRFHAVVTLDTPVRKLNPEQAAKRRAIAGRPLRRYRSQAEAVAAFKTVPPLESPSPELVSRVARSSFRRVGDEWVLHCDPKLYARVTDVDAFLRPLPANTLCVRAERGLITDAMQQQIAMHLGGAGRIVTMPGVSHNFILEEPLATAWLVLALVHGIPGGRDAPS